MQMTLTDNYSFYDASVDATIFHSFATAAYRFGHTFLNGIFKLVQGLTEISSYRIRDNFFVSNQLTQNGGKGYDWILGGLQTQNAQAFDPFVTEDFTNFVLRLPTEEFGQDLIARNIQRGRDHGLQPWQTYRRVCGLPTADTWADKPADVRQDSWDKLKTLYKSPEDIELFTGGLIEFPPIGALTGATFNCLKAEQFSRLKKGDRFFFTHQNQAGSFSLTQMRNIRRRTLGDIMCENSGLDMTTANVFLIPSPTNPWIPCNSTTRTKLAFDLLVV
jgi:peroxidase